MPDLNQMADLWWSWVSRITLQVGFLTLLIWGSELLFRSRMWPQLRWLLWMLVLLRLVLPPGFSTPLSLTAPVYERAGTVFLAERTASELKASREAGALSAKASSPLIQGSSSTPEIAQPSEQTRAAIGLLPVPELTWKAKVMVGWAAISGILLLGFFGICYRLRSQLLAGAHSDPITDRRSLVVAREVGVHGVPVLHSRRVSAPAVFGIIRPFVLLPEAAISGRDGVDLRNILRHEMLHIRRGDLLWQRIALILHCLHWFNPLLFLVRRRLGQVTELCCDARVARLLGEQRNSYQRTLLRAAQPFIRSSRRLGPEQIGLLEQPGQLRDRLYWLRHDRLAKSRWVWVGITGLLAGGLVLPMASPVAEDGQVPEFTAVRIGTYQPTGQGQIYLDRIEVLKRSLDAGYHVRWQAAFLPSGSWDLTRSRRPHFSPQNCRQSRGDRIAREEIVQGFQTLVQESRFRGEPTYAEFYLAPALGCIELKAVQISPTGVYRSEVVDLRMGPPLSEESFRLDVLKQRVTGLVPGEEPIRQRLTDELQAEYRRAFPGLLELFDSFRERFANYPSKESYDAHVRRLRNRLGMWDGEPLPAQEFKYGFFRRFHSRIAPDGRVFMAGERADQIDLVSDSGRIEERFPIEMEELPVTTRLFAADSNGSLHVLLPPRDEFYHRWTRVRYFQDSRTFVDIDLSRSVKEPVDFSVDERGKYYVLNRGDRSYQLFRFSSQGDLEFSLDLDPEQLPAFPEAAIGRRVAHATHLGVLADGSTYLLLKRWFNRNEVVALEGQIYRVDWERQEMTPLDPITVDGTLLSVTALHADNDQLVVESTDWEELKEAVELDTLLRKLYFWRQGVLQEPEVTIRGQIFSVAAGKVLVGPPAGRTLDNPPLYLVYFE